MWVDTGYYDNGNPIYVQFSGGNPWKGAFVGTEQGILDYQREYREKQANSSERLQKLNTDLGVNVNSIEGVQVIMDDTDESSADKVYKASSDIGVGTSSITREEVVWEDDMVGSKQEMDDEYKTFLSLLHSKLMAPNNWTEDALKNYISLCIARINHCIAKKKDCSDWLVFSKDKSMVILNSGLLNKFGKYITLITKVYGSKAGKPMELSHTSIRVSGGKAFLSDKGFEKSALNRDIERVAFSDNGLMDLIFVGDIEDFDLESRNRLEHCVEERRFRFPETICDAPSEVICSDIIRAIEIGVELNKYDRNYIKPIYSRSNDTISFVIPYHISNDFQKKPELGIVIGMVGGYWQIMTVLDYEMVLNDTKLFNMYENETF